ncbi:MAG: PilZ domain-containing protein [Sphingomonadaceae bacterium]|nr:PilZ domain-containing protein [Sphingomonadaceae bacterium]
MDRPSGVTPSGGAHDPQQARIARRYKVFEATRMTCGAAESRVHIINLSLTGALVHATHPPEPGAHVTIDLAEMGVAARVVWIVGERFGVAFDKPLDENALARIVPS